MTTLAIKRGQYKPAKVEKVASNRWKIQSLSSDQDRTVTRFKNRFTCDCPATSPTCRHVTAVLMDEMRAKGWVAAVWTHYKEARRQKRKIWVCYRNSRQFWVTGRPAPWVRRPHKRGRFWMMETDPWRKPVHDCYWFVEGNPVRVPVTLRGA